MQIDWSINLVAIIQLIMFVGGGMWFIASIRGDVNSLQKSFAEIKKHVEALTTAVSSIAVAEEKIAGIKERLDNDKEAGFEFRKWAREEIQMIWGAIRGQIADIGHHTAVTPL